MFELNGTKYTIDQVQQAAKANGMSLEDYIQRSGLVKIEAVVEDEIATAAADTVNSELQSDIGLLGSPRLNLGADLEDGLTPEQRIQQKREEYTPEDLASIKFQFDKGLEYGKTFGEEAYNKYIETGEIDTNLLPKQNRLVDPATGERLSELDVLRNVGRNVPEQLDNMWSSTKIMLYNFAEAASRQGALNTGLGVGANVLLDDQQRDFQDKAAEESKDLFNKEIQDNYQTILDNYKEMAKNPTGAGILGSGSTGLAGKASMVDLVGGLGTAVTSVATSVLPAAAAGVVAGPAGSVAMMGNLIIPSMVTDYNIEKANNLYKDLPTEEERINRLVEEDKEELGIPIALGTIATALEYVGYKGIAQEMAKNMSKAGYKDLAKSVFAISKTKPGVNAATTTVRESATEVVQLFPELTNQAAAKGLSFEEGSLYVLENFVEQAPEVAIQAAFGTRIFQGASSSLFKTAKIVRDKFPGVEGVDANSFFTLGVLKQRKDTETNEDVAIGLNNAIAIEEQKIKQAVRNGNNIVRKLDDKEVDIISKSSEAIEEIQNKINNLKEEKELGLIDNAQYDTAIAGYNGKIDLENIKINKIVEDAVTRENIREKDLSFTTKYDTFLEATRVASESRTSNKIAFDNYKEQIKKLEDQKRQNLIDDVQFENKRKSLVSDYARIKKDNDAKIGKLQNELKGVAASSVEASLKLQKAFDDGVADGIITKDADGKNVIGNKAYEQILETQLPFIKKLTNTIWNNIPKDKIVANAEKTDLESNIKSVGLLDLLRTYDGQIPLGAYLQQRLPQRAISKAVLKDISNQQFTKDLESSTVQGMIAEEDSEVAPEIKNINTAQALNIGNDLLTTIKDVAKKALLTTQQKVDATKFKSDISKTFKDALYTDIKQKLGLKNTKLKKGLTSAIEANPEAFYDAIAVESMRMARAKGGINPYEAVGLLINKNGKLEKAPFNQNTFNKFLNYFTDPEEKLKKAARSDRQMNLIEALAVSMGAREAINLLENDTEFRQRFAEQQQQEQQTKDFENAADNVNNVSKGLGKAINFFQKSFNTIKDNIIGGKNSYDKILSKFSNKGVDLGKTLVINRNNQKNREELKTWFGKMATYFPRKFFELSSESFNKSSSRFAFDNVNDYNEFLNSVEFLPNDFKGDWSQFGRVKYENLNKSDELRNKLISEYKNNWQDISKKQETNMDVLEYVVKKFETMYKDDPKNAKYIATFFKTATNSQGHILRMAAPLRAYSTNLSKGMMREEHTMPSSMVGNYLLYSILDGNVDSVFKGIRKNYFQVALNKDDDNKLKPVGLNENMPEGWTLADNSWARYFNTLVNSINGGIDPNGILFFQTNKSVAQTFNVGFDGTVIPDVKKLQQESIAEQTGDKVENLIDRAIAKLTELTGTEGTLQTNLGAVPINIVIGGLRATKLAYKGGKALADAIADGYKKVKDYMSAKEWSDFVTKYTKEVRNEKNPAQVKLAILSEKGVAQVQEQSRKTDEALLKEFGIEIEGLTTDEIVDKLSILRKAKVVGSNDKAPIKKARVFDFDDTLAKTNSKVLYTLPDVTEGSLDATQFAEQYNELQEAGATFDYSEFNQVKDGSKGPLATLAKRFTESKGDRDVFVLTARPAESAEAIQEFLRSTLGISIPLRNISGLGNGTPGAKAMWVAEKVSEGYNDVFFADDSKANVDAVSRMLDNLGATKRVQQAKESGQRSLEDEMDSLIRGKKRSKIGKFLSKYNIYIPPGADDFAGLLKYFQAKGKLGEEQMKWFEENLLTPFAQGISAYTTAKVSLANDFKEVNKRFKNYRTFGVPSKFRKLLSKEVLGGIYTNEQAVRAYLYDKAGQDLGLNKADTQDLIALVEGNGELKAYADEISKITKLDAGYPPIPEQWLGGSIATDMAVVSNVAQRAEFLQEFTNNKNQIFSDQNMKLIKQIYGNDYADALSNILERMQTGKNRKKGKDKEFNSAMNWINQSVGAIMAVNMRSAILQQLSTVNYMNWNFNNPIKMGLAMANVPQFRKDYIKILNSDFLKERRGGMAIEVNLADIADSNPGNIFLRLNKKVLELGFKPTQWGDSNAIAFGGATWYRNRYNELIKEGMSESEADSQAMLELQEVSETAQQSSRPDKISRQQASDIGRIILAFANTPLQYARETRKATLDLVNGRGDWKTNASKIIYYGVAQNLIFTALQQGLFSLLLGGDDENEKEKESKNKKTMYAVNNVVDGILRGMGYAGAVVSALKNLGMEYYDQKQKRDEGKTVRDSSLRLIQKGLTISPPVSKKIGDIIEGQKFETWRQYKNDPFYQAFAYANYVSGLTNLPIDRLFKKVENLRAASQDSTEAWQSVFLSLGWSPYNVGVQFPERQDSGTRRRRKKRQRRKKISSLNKRLPQGVLGRANNDGTIEVKEGLSPTKKKQVIAHEKKHIADMKSGKLNYDDNFVYYKGDKHKRIEGKIEYKGKKYLEGSSKLPWEAAANRVEKQVS